MPWFLFCVVASAFQTERSTAVQCRPSAATSQPAPAVTPSPVEEFERRRRVPPWAR